ncbi:carbohydrate kinase family protein [Microbacterium sp. NPDC057407]|uniref:carbohydrate kinase family protein n=1 Tax=Microbacterium sp. NPDC057407 TaxID=3346120 RepID=UPI0036713DC9
MIVVVGDLVADIVVLGASALEHATDNPARVALTRGGSAANVAAAAARQHPVRFIGRVGDDTIGRTLVAELEAVGVEARVQCGGRTGAIVVLVDDAGERTMITDRGAAADLDRIDPSWIHGADWLHLPLYGFASERSRTAITDAAAAVSRRGAPVSLDLSSVATLRELGGEQLSAVVGRIRPSVVFANADEAQVARDLGLDPAGADFVVKRGADPVRVTSQGRTAEVPVTRVTDVVDSTGAGDAFAAGYIVSALRGGDPWASAAAGSRHAAAALRVAGAL